MAQGGFLRAPRVRVFWGDINLSAYNGDQDFPKDTPVVYDVQVDSADQTEGGTGSMRWDPTGPGGALYEWFVTKEEYMKKQITVEFFYPRGKKVVFYFVWAGQEINFGNDMTITIKLQSELAGLINANQRNVAQAYDEKKGTVPTNVVDKTKKQYNVDKYKDIVQYNPFTLEYWKTVKIGTFYANDSTFGAAVNQIAKQTGDKITPNNIGGSNLIVVPPYSWKDPKTKKEAEVLNGATDIKAGENPDPKQRYGYILGPSIINTMRREATMPPPQKTNTNTPNTQAFATKPANQNYSSPQNPDTNQQASIKGAAAKATSSPLGTANGRATPGVGNVDNPYGPDRQNALNQENSSKLSLDTLMCPVLVGVKPNDILFIPSFTGNFMEDWEVKSVGYTQSNGNVTVNIQATRVFATSSPMKKKAYDKFLAFAKEKGLVGPNASLENWDAYAWGLPGSPSPASPAPGEDLFSEENTRLTGNESATSFAN